MSHQVVKVKREAVSPCMTCPLCDNLVRDATTVIECLHTFCRKCIHKKLSDEEMDCCPICNIALGCAPLEKLRSDHNLQDMRAKIFPRKRVKVSAPEVVTPVVLPAKRKERSLSSLVISTPRVSPHPGMTGRRSKSTPRKSSKGSSFTMEKPIMNSDIDHPESSNSPETPNKSVQHNSQQNPVSEEPSNEPSHDKGRDNHSELRDGIIDRWDPLTCLVEAANRTKSSKFGAQGPLVKSEEQPSYENVDPLIKKENKGSPKRPRTKDEKQGSDHSTPMESERPKKMHKIHQKAQEYGDFGVQSQVVLDAASAKFERKRYPIWFSLVASDELGGDASALPQISASYLRIKDGTIPVSFIQKYLKRKLDLTNEAEVDIKCMGQKIIPTLTLNNVVDFWLQTTCGDRVSATMGSSAKDFVMVLRYCRRVNDS